MVDKSNKWNARNVLSSLLSTIVVVCAFKLCALLTGVTWYELLIVFVLFMGLLKMKGYHYEPPKGKEP
jgi:hypothetical protein